jgi:CDP-diacylglycerol--glycerol-3-phosphate 3-phosphatidyltransferase
MSVRFLYTPTEFFENLIRVVNEAKTRVSIATLYVGNSPLEQRLLQTLGASRADVHILLDGLRGNRRDAPQDRTSIEMIRNHCPNATVEQFISPLFRGIYRHLPQRINEIVGTQHMKLVVADNDLVITGANLSSNYFSNRQDRYVIVRDASLADQVTKLIRTSGLTCANSNTQTGDATRICYSTQRGFDMKEGQTDRVTTSLLEDLVDSGREVEVFIASPYLNLSQDIFELLAQLPKVHIITNSEATNAFHNSKGPSRFIPEAYSIIQDDLMKSLNCDGRFVFHEYTRPGWSFHPKGIWVSRNSRFSETIIGSSNFGYRSRFRDLEISFRLSNRAEWFHSQLEEELDGIMRYTELVGTPRPKRRWWLRGVVTSGLRSFL